MWGYCECNVQFWTAGLSCFILRNSKAPQLSNVGHFTGNFLCLQQKIRESWMWWSQETSFFISSSNFAFARYHLDPGRTDYQWMQSAFEISSSTWWPFIVQHVVKHSRLPQLAFLCCFTSCVELQLHHLVDVIICCSCHRRFNENVVSDTKRQGPQMETITICAYYNMLDWVLGFLLRPTERF